MVIAIIALSIAIVIVTFLALCAFMAVGKINEELESANKCCEMLRKELEFIHKIEP